MNLPACDSITSVQWKSSELAPLAIFNGALLAGALTNVWYWRYTSAKYSARMLPPQPQVSLPTPKNGTFQGFSRPFLRRSCTSVELVSDIMYSTQSAISCGVPEPTLPET